MRHYPILRFAHAYKKQHAQVLRITLSSILIMYLTDLR